MLLGNCRLDSTLVDRFQQRTWILNPLVHGEMIHAAALPTMPRTVLHQKPARPVALRASVAVPCGVGRNPLVGGWICVIHRRGAASPLKPVDTKVVILICGALAAMSSSVMHLITAERASRAAEVIPTRW